MYFGPQLQGGRPSSKRERARESLLNWRRQHLQIYAKSQRRKQKPGQVANEPFLLLFLADALFATTLYMKSAAYCFPNFLSLPNSQELYQGARNDCAAAPPPLPTPPFNWKRRIKSGSFPFPVCAALQEQPDANGYQEFSIRHIPTATPLYLRPRPLTGWAGRLYSGTYNEIVREMENK